MANKSQQIALIEKTLVMHADKFRDVLPASLPWQRMIRTVMVSVRRMPSLANDIPSLLGAAMSAAVLGLEADGLMGQGAIIPFKGKAQFLVMVGGYCTLAARAGRTLQGWCVYEGDRFEFNEPMGEVHHTWKLTDAKRSDDRIIAAYAVSRAHDAPTLLKVMSLADIVAIRNQTAGWKSGRDTPWKTHFPAMAEKTVMRQLAKRLPFISLQMAGALDTQHDLGRHAQLTPESTVVVEGEVLEDVERSDRQPTTQELLGDTRQSDDANPPAARSA